MKNEAIACNGNVGKMEKHTHTKRKSVSNCRQIWTIADCFILNLYSISMCVCVCIWASVACSQNIVPTTRLHEWRSNKSVQFQCSEFSHGALHREHSPNTPQLLNDKECRKSCITIWFGVRIKCNFCLVHQHNNTTRTQFDSMERAFNALLWRVFVFLQIRCNFVHFSWNIFFCEFPNKLLNKTTV